MKQSLRVFLILGAVLTAGRSQAATVDTASQKVLSDSAWAYGSLSGMKVRFTNQASSAKPARVTGQFWFFAPNLVRLDRTVGGRTLKSLSNNAKLYRQLDSKTYSEDNAAPMPSAVSAVWQDIPSQVPTLLGPLLLGNSPAGIFEYQKQKVTHRRSGGYDVLRIVPLAGSPYKGTTIEYRFGVRDHLLYRADSLTPGGTRAVSTRTTLSHYELKPSFPKGSFVFKPGKGMKKSSGTVTAQNQRPDEKFRVGNRPLPITGTDLKGKKRSLNDFKGKIVLVDFWATWCGPCIGELPNIQRAYRQYHGRGFEVLAISLDENKNDLTKFVKQNKLPWTQLYSGKGWKDPNAQRYNVNGIPFSILIGPDGRIVAVDPRGDELEKALAPLMKGWI